MLNLRRGTVQLKNMGLSNVGGYPSETHLKLKTRNISLVHNIPFSLHMFLLFCRDHVSITAVQCTTIQNGWVNMKKAMGKRDLAWFEFKIRFWHISYVAQGPWLWSWSKKQKTKKTQKHKNTHKKYQPLPVASTSYHYFMKIRYPIILLKDEWKQHTKNPVIIFK